MRRFEFVKNNHNLANPARQLPKRVTQYSIAYDIFSPFDVVIQPKHSHLIWTNIKARFESDEALIINVRSSMGKNKIMIANTQAWIESDYYDNPENDGNIGINLYNFGDTDYHIAVGDRIAQYYSAER